MMVKLFIKFVYSILVYIKLEDVIMVIELDYVD